MAIQIPRRLITIDEYEKMIAAGVFAEDDRSELIRGEIVEMPPIGLRHASCVGRLTKRLEKIVGDDAIVWVQNPICAVGNSLPQPDLALLQPRADFYEQSRPMPSDVFLVIEVSDSTLETDIAVKVPLYAESGIEEVWIVNLHDDVVEIYSGPTAGRYSSVHRAAVGQAIPLPGGFAADVEVKDILG